MNNTVNGGLMATFETNKPYPAPMVHVYVEMEASEVVSAMADAVRMDIERIGDWAGIPLPDVLEKDMLVSYIVTLMYLRAHTTYPTPKSTKDLEPYKVVKDRLAIPSLLYQVLICIGRCTDPDYNIELIPTVTVDSKGLLAPEDLLRVSDVLHMYQNSGFKMVTGLPKSPEGELDFMAMSLLEDGLITSYKKSHPVYGFLHSFLKTKQISEITGGLSRIYYGNVAGYISSIFSAYNAISNVEPSIKKAPGFKSKKKPFEKKEVTNDENVEG